MLGPLHSAGDGDLYWQRWLGDALLQTHRLPSALGSETFTAAGAAWIPQEWFFSLVVALAAKYHLMLLLSLVMSALPIAILLSIYFRARPIASPAAIGLALIFCGLAFLESFGVRAQVLGWAALAAFVLFLERRDRWYYAAFPTAIVWANLHASVMLAPVLVLANIAATIADGGWRALRTSRDVVMLPAVLLATLCTPFGWRLPAFAIAFAASPIRHFIEEWQPTGFHDWSFTLGALPLALAIVLGGRATMLRQKSLSFPAAVLFAAMLFAGRNIPLFAIVAAPLAASGLDNRFARVRELGNRLRELERAAIVATSVAVILSGIALWRVQQHESPPLPVAAISQLAADGSAHRLLCQDFTWCSAALQFRTLQVFLDGRCDAYPLGVWREYIAAVKVEKSWSDTLERYGVDAILARRGTRLADALAKDDHWRRTFGDGPFVTFRRE